MKLVFLSQVVLAALTCSTLVWWVESFNRMNAARELATNDIGIVCNAQQPKWLPIPISNKTLFRRPVLAEIYVYISNEGEIEIQREKYDIAGAKRRLLELRNEITEETGIANAHVIFASDDCSVEEMHESKPSAAVYSQLHAFAYESSFVSTGSMTKDQVPLRKQSMDPKNYMGRVE